MLESESPGTSAARKETARVLRERLSAVPRQIIAENQERTRIRRRIVEALGQDPRTVPEIAAATDLPSHEVLWHLMAMRKYGMIVEGEARGDYYEYALSEEQEKAK
ncbi:MAG: winged helix-turn-helix transcriptional regulator [Rhodopirellula sp.]|nr:winged helix-turn-helix transcriptional regulator [Rhodopirellula sp.]